MLGFLRFWSMKIGRSISPPSSSLERPDGAASNPPAYFSRKRMPQHPISGRLLYYRLEGQKPPNIGADAAE